MKKYYEILEVNPKASIEVIEKAYKVLVKKYHPDSYEGEGKIYAEQRIRDINEAYKILSDEFLREQYDIELQKEMQYNYLYKEDTNKKKTNRKLKHSNINNNENEEINLKSDIGTYRGILSITKILLKNKPKFKDIRDLKKEDYIAAGLTVVIVLIVGIVLWFIPQTNGFIKGMIPFID